MQTSQSVYLMIDEFWMTQEMLRWCRHFLTGFWVLISQNVTVNASGMCVTQGSRVSQRCQTCHMLNIYVPFVVDNGIYGDALNFICTWILWNNWLVRDLIRNFLICGKTSATRGGLYVCHIITGNWAQSDRMLCIVVLLGIESREAWKEHVGDYSSYSFPEIRVVKKCLKILKC